MAAGENTGSTKKPKSSGGSGGAKQCGGLVNLLKDGLLQGNVEAQEYALWSLSSISDTASRSAMVEAGIITPLIASLSSGKLSAIAQEHASIVLSGLAPAGDNAKVIKGVRDCATK